MVTVSDLNTILSTMDRGSFNGMSMGSLFNSHSVAPIKIGPVMKDQYDDYMHRQALNIRKSFNRMSYPTTVAHIMSEEGLICGEGYEYICKRINSGEAFGPELKDLKLTKSIADTLLTMSRLHKAVENNDWKRANAIISKNPKTVDESRTSKARSTREELFCLPTLRS